MQFNASENDQITVPAGIADFYNTTAGTISFWMRSSGTSGSGGDGAVLFDYAIDPRHVDHANRRRANPRALLSDWQFRVGDRFHFQRHGQRQSMASRRRELHADGGKRLFGLYRRRTRQLGHQRQFGLGVDDQLSHRNRTLHESLHRRRRTTTASWTISASTTRSLTAAQIASIAKGADESVNSGGRRFECAKPDGGRQLFGVHSHSFQHHRSGQHQRFTAFPQIQRRLYRLDQRPASCRRTMRRFTRLEFRRDRRPFAGQDVDRLYRRSDRPAAYRHEYPRHPGPELFRLRSELPDRAAIVRQCHVGLRHGRKIFRHAHSRKRQWQRNRRFGADRDQRFANRRLNRRPAIRSSLPPRSRRPSIPFKPVP